MGLYGTAWLTYLGQVDGCILDFAGLEEQRVQGLAKGVSKKQADDYVNTYSTQQQNKARKVLAPERVLVLPVKESVAKKAELAAAFIQKLG